MKHSFGVAAFLVRSWRFAAGALAAVALTAAPVCAETYSFGDFGVDVNGFGTLGLVYSDSDLLGFRRTQAQSKAVFDGDISHKTDSLLGVQGVFRYKQLPEAVVQVKTRSSHKGFSTDVNLAYLRFKPTPVSTLRLGRLSHDAYLLTESRDIGMAYLWVRPSVEFYGQLLLEHFDGVDFNYRWLKPNGFLEWRIGGGVFDVYSAYACGLVVSGHYDPMLMTNLHYQGEYWSWRLGYMSADLERYQVDGLDEVLARVKPYLSEFPAGFMQTAFVDNPTSSSIEQYSVALAYDNKPWLVQAELGGMELGRQFLSGYLSVGYSFGRVTPFALVGFIEGEARSTPVNDYQLSDELDVKIGHLYNVLRGDAKQTALSLGLRWDISLNLALKAQWDHRRVSKNKVFLWMERPGVPRDERVNTASLTLDFAF